MTSTLVDTAAFSLVLGHSVEMSLIVNINVPKYDFFVELQNGTLHHNVKKH